MKKYVSTRNRCVVPGVEVQRLEKQISKSAKRYLATTWNGSTGLTQLSKSVAKSKTCGDILQFFNSKGKELNLRLVFEEYHEIFDKSLAIRLFSKKTPGSFGVLWS